MVFRRFVPAGLVLLAIACAPATDWREVRPEGSQASALFPCKPSSHARIVALAGERVRLTLHACSAADATWALAHADLADPGRVAQALEDLRAAASANLGAAEARPLPGQVVGATPNPQAGRFELLGRLPDGQAAQEQLALFARGTRVFQATVIGARLDGQAMESFFGGLRVGP